LPNDFKMRLPSFEEGRPRRSNEGTLPQEIGAAGEVKTLRQTCVWPPAPRRF